MESHLNLHGKCICVPQETYVTHGNFIITSVPQEMHITHGKSITIYVPQDMYQPPWEIYYYMHPTGYVSNPMGNISLRPTGYVSNPMGNLLLCLSHRKYINPMGNKLSCASHRICIKPHG